MGLEGTFAGQYPIRADDQAASNPPAVYGKISGISIHLAADGCDWSSLYSDADET